MLIGPHVLESQTILRQDQKPGGTYCLSASFVIQSVRAAVQSQLWDWTGLGLPLVPHDKGGSEWAVLLVGLHWLLTAELRGLSRAQHSSKRERGRETLSNNSTAKESADTFIPTPNPQL